MVISCFTCLWLEDRVVDRPPRGKEVGVLAIEIFYTEMMRAQSRVGEGNGTPLQYSCLENPWTEEPGRLQSMGSLRVGHN